MRDWIKLWYKWVRLYWICRVFFVMVTCLQLSFFTYWTAAFRKTLCQWFITYVSPTLCRNNYPLHYCIWITLLLFTLCFLFHDVYNVYWITGRQVNVQKLFNGIITHILKWDLMLFQILLTTTSYFCKLVWRSSRFLDEKRK